VTLHLAFRYRVLTLDIVWKGYVEVTVRYVSKRGQVPYVTRAMTSLLDVVTVGLPIVWRFPPPSRRGAPSRRVCDEK
jgi:hypothetical protein